jgi:hypothetical protein
MTRFLQPGLVMILSRNRVAVTHFRLLSLVMTRHPQPGGWS